MEVIFILGSFHPSSRVEGRNHPTPRIRVIGYKHLLGLWLSLIPSTMCLCLYFLKGPAFVTELPGPHLSFTIALVNFLPVVDHYPALWWILLFLSAFASICVIFLLVIILCIFYALASSVVHAAGSRLRPRVRVPDTQSNHPGWVPICADMFVGIMNILALHFYCSVLYDSQATSTSGWTENLP